MFSAANNSALSRLNSAKQVDVLWDDGLRNGIWPRSWTFWIIVFWMAWVFIRPWERLFPELAAYRPEFTFAVFAMAAVLLAGRFRFVPSFQTTGLMFWIGALTISAVFAHDVSASLDTLYRSTTLMVLFFMLLSVVRSPYQLVFVIAAFVAVVSAYLAKSQWEYFVHGGFTYSMGVRRLQGIDTTFQHPNSVAISTVITMPFGFLLWTIRREFTANWPIQWRRLFPWALAAFFWLAFSSVVLTNGRAGMLGAVLFVFLTATRYGNFEKLFSRVAIALVLVAAIWLAMPEKNKDRFRTVWDPDSGPQSAQSSAEGRWVGFQQGVEAFRRFPVTGVGIGNWKPYRSAHLDGGTLKTHNTVGGVLAETGALGAAAFLVFVSGVFLNCRTIKLLSPRNLQSGAPVLLELGIACRNSLFLLLFLGLAGDIQYRPQLFWVAAFCLLARVFAENLARQEPLGDDWREMAPADAGAHTAPEMAQFVT